MNLHFAHVIALRQTSHLKYGTALHRFLLRSNGR
jgi:hypothetical protein